MSLQEKACRLIYSVIRARCPIDTGNLATHGITIESDFSKIFIGNEVADYAEYTNEPWTHGTNPNEGWIDNAIQESLPLVKNLLSGTISQTEYDQIISDYEQILKARMDARAKEILGVL